MVELLTNPSLKRAAVGALAAALIALNRKLGLQLETADVAAIVALAVAFIGQSAAKEVKLAGLEAAKKVDSPEAARAVLEQPGPKP
jgi:hypothetical protein